MTRFSKDLQWLEPYFEIAKQIIPNAKNLTHVRKTVPKKGQIARQEGALSKDVEPRNRKYSMTLYVRWRRVKKLTPQRKRGHYTATCEIRHSSKIDLLCTFAHELSHLVWWDHTPQHKMLEAKLTLLFMAKLMEEGYISEEEELKRKKTEREC